MGWKATGRGLAGTELVDTLSLLAGAASLGLVERLDWAFRCLAFDRAIDAAIGVPLHITPEPDTFVSACPPRLAVSFGRGRRALSVAAELHEDAFTDIGRLRTSSATGGGRSCWLTSPVSPRRRRRWAGFPPMSCR
jgi:hypothetical protein